MCSVTQNLCTETQNPQESYVFKNAFMYGQRLDQWKGLPRTYINVVFFSLILKDGYGLLK